MFLRPALMIALVALGLGALGRDAEPVKAMPAPHMSDGQVAYSEACGGCHGLTGVSAADYVPVLEGQVGRFLCLREGREYVARLPNVVFANMSDDRLARVMNFVMFGLGGESVPKGSPFSTPYTATEVKQLRANPLKASDLAQMRREILVRTARNCPPRVARNSVSQ